MNPVFQQLQSHRSIRQFTDQPLPSGLLDDLIRAGQGTATSSFLQGVTVIRVTRPDLRESLKAVAADQRYIVEAAEFLVFCADLKRASDCCAYHGAQPTEGFTEQFIIATVDVALFAQNVVTAAEAAGLGICYIGALRNDPARVCDLLGLPRLVYPVFGLCLGYPAQDPEIKPRLPLEVVLREDGYGDQDIGEWIDDYDATMRNYYRTRSNNTKSIGWSEQMATLLGKEKRVHMRSFLAARGFEMK